MLYSQVAAWYSIGSKREAVTGFEQAFTCLGGGHATRWGTIPPQTWEELFYSPTKGAFSLLFLLLPLWFEPSKLQTGPQIADDLFVVRIGCKSKLVKICYSRRRWNGWAYLNFVKLQVHYKPSNSISSKKSRKYRLYFHCAVALSFLFSYKHFCSGFSWLQPLALFLQSIFCY